MFRMTGMKEGILHFVQNDRSSFRMTGMKDGILHFVQNDRNERWDSSLRSE
ncbi:MAG: hypothetical protein P4L35_05875 [Ignavibacteriaceae bacterium]|nr:hypothetical protein [Ignavibacteriaceae bacterium]